MVSTAGFFRRILRSITQQRPLSGGGSGFLQCPSLISTGPRALICLIDIYLAQLWRDALVAGPYATRREMMPGAISARDEVSPPFVHFLRSAFEPGINLNTTLRRPGNLLEWSHKCIKETRG